MLLEKGRLQVVTRRLAARRLLRRRRLQVAPLRLRLLAALISVKAAIAFFALAIGALVGAFTLAGRWRGYSKRKPPASSEKRQALRLARSDGRSETNPLLDALRRPRVRIPLELSAFALAAAWEPRRGLGARALGLRLVDARTGDAISRQQALIRVGARRIWQAIAHRLFPWPEVRPLHENEGLRSELDAARREHAEDREALEDALKRIYRQHHMNPVRTSCLPSLLRLLIAVAVDVPLPWTPLRQSVADKLAGTVVIAERGGARKRRVAARLN